MIERSGLKPSSVVTLTLTLPVDFFSRARRIVSVARISASESAVKVSKTPSHLPCSNKWGETREVIAREVRRAAGWQGDGDRERGEKGCNLS